ncbi:hypothetical protein, partial [Vibrio diabolicus]|uniref:hypothetical protein n=1 Tax=Vibrio diabolicus TaxID=50719 RepID=UPI0029410BB7
MSSIVKIENVDNDSAVSVSIQRMMSVVGADKRFEIVECNKGIDETKKCDIYTSIAIGVATGLATNVLYDIIKMVFVNNPSKDNDGKIVINGDVVYVKEIKNITVSN